MSYRDDHDAAIARIDSLEHELARADEDRERYKRELRRLERRVAQLEGKADETIELTPDMREHELPRWITVGSKMIGGIVFAMLAVIIVLGLAAPG